MQRPAGQPNLYRSGPSLLWYLYLYPADDEPRIRQYLYTADDEPRRCQWCCLLFLAGWGVRCRRHAHNFRLSQDAA